MRDHHRFEETPNSVWRGAVAQCRLVKTSLKDSKECGKSEDVASNALLIGFPCFEGAELGTCPCGRLSGVGIRGSTGISAGPVLGSDLPARYSFSYDVGMLNLQSTTSPRWLRQVVDHLDDVLVDHALCEMKAASTAMNLMFAYIEDQQLCRDLTEIVREELEHFHMVLHVLADRGISFHRLKPGNYGKQLHSHVRKQEPGRAVDRMLVAALIEARSCERFDILCKSLEDKELATFFGSLFESEARHHATYVRLAGHFDDEDHVRDRLRQLAVAEAEIIASGDPLARVHS